MNKDLTPQEALERVKLMMKYDLKKTLNENINEDTTNIEWFKTVAKSFMKDPTQINTVNFGSPSGDINARVTAFNKAISGIGRDNEGITYAISKSMTNIADSMAFLKMYPQVNGESLYDALGESFSLKGEWFSGKIMDNVVNIIANQLSTWCQSNPKQSICTPKSSVEQKYGKL